MEVPPAPHFVFHLPGVLEAAGDVQNRCEQNDFRFCFIGGVAVQRWGAPRLIQDVDLTLVFAGRDRDWAGVEGILARQHGKLGTLAETVAHRLAARSEEE